MYLGVGEVKPERPKVGETYGPPSDRRLVLGTGGIHVSWRRPKGTKITDTRYKDWAKWLLHHESPQLQLFKRKKPVQVGLKYDTLDGLTEFMEN